MLKLLIKLYTVQPNELEQLMLFAITKQRTDFVKLLMDYGCDLKKVSGSFDALL